MRLPDVPYVLRPGIIELRWGDPRRIVAADELARAAAHALESPRPGRAQLRAEQGPRLLGAAGGMVWRALKESLAPVEAAVHHRRGCRRPWTYLHAVGAGAVT